MRDVMVDIETLGVRPGSVLPSVGLTGFDPETGALGPSFECVINIGSSLSHGLTTDPSTLDWWKKQKPEAQAVIFDSLSGGLSLTEAIDGITAFWMALPEPGKTRLWGNGSDFDNVLLTAAYRVLGRTPPWTPWNGRCFRTLKNLFPGHEPERQGIHHNALADARHQARWALAIAKARRAI